jgi:localization factor PodJL
VLYARGLGVEQDFRKSWLWFSLAATQGDADAAKKRDEVAAKMNPAELATAADELAKFKVATPDPAANDVASPPGGWDAKPVTQTIPALGGQRPQARL